MVEQTKQADEIFTEFQEHSVAEFFRKNKQMLGFSGKVKSLTTIIHEYVTNSLDACEEAGILPEINVKITQLGEDNYYLKVTDNGPGIPTTHVGKVFGTMLAGTKFHRYMQQRGQQGIGATGCTMFAQLTTGKPLRIKTSTGNGKVFECNMGIDVKTNQAVMTNIQEYDEEFRGTEVSGEFGEVKYERSEYGPLEYLKRTAIANPHAEILFVDPEGKKVKFPRVLEIIPDKPEEIKPHPLGIEAQDLYEYLKRSDAKKISAFLMSEFSRISQAKINEIQKYVPEIDLNGDPTKITWEDSKRLVTAFKRIKWIAPSAEALRPIGNEHIEVSLRSLLKPEFISVRSRLPKVYRGGVPFIIEAAITYGGHSGKVNQSGQKSSEVLRYANRSPLLFDAGGCATYKSVKSVDWKRYEIRNFDDAPISVFVNVVSAFVPYTGAGKQSISSEPEIADEIKFAVMDVARDLNKYLSGKVREERKEAKRKAIMRYIKQLSLALPELANSGNSEEIEKKLSAIVLDRFTVEDTGEDEDAETRDIMIEDDSAISEESEGEGDIEFDAEDM